MADSSNGNFSRQNKGKRKSRKEYVQKRSKIYKDVEDKELFANNGLKSEFKLNSDNDLQEEESKHERNDDKDTPKKKRKVEFDIGDSSLINKDELTGMLNEIASGQIKKVKKIKLKRKANVNVSDRELRNSKNTFKAQGIEDGNATCKEDTNNTIVTSSAHPAIDYLVLWKKNRSEWSFKKSRQIWLLKNIYDETKVVLDYCFLHSQTFTIYFIIL